MDDNQLEIYSAVQESKNKFFIIECARRLGKSFLLCVMAIEKCLQKPGARVLYAAPTTKDAQEIVAPLIEEICKTAPFEVKFDRQQSKFIFPGKSQLRLFGCDNKTKANRGRGSGAHLVLIDEAGFVPTLDYVLHSIVAPQTLTTRGRVILASTPSDEPDHPFTTLAEKAESNGYYVRKTIYDNPRLTTPEIDQYVEDDAAILGMTVDEFKLSDVYKREHLAIREIDTNLVVVPEWKGAFATVDKPKFYDCYVSLDMGGVDPHAAIFGYWDFEKQCLVIEDEILLRDGENTAEIAEKIKAKEEFLWGANRWDGTLRGIKEAERVPEWVKHSFGDAPLQPYLRVCDNDIQIARDLSQLHGVTFIPTEKHEKWLQVNATRVLMREGKIRIHPRCRNLDRHLRTTMWANEQLKTYRRRNGEHGDLVDCLVYLVRNIRRMRNPAPKNYGQDPENTWTRPPEKKSSWIPGWMQDVTRVRK